MAGSPFLTAPNAGGDLVAGPDCTVASTRYDEVVTPYTSQFLAGDPRRVTDITLQTACPPTPTSTTRRRTTRWSRGGC